MKRDRVINTSLVQWFLSWPLRTHLLLMASFLAVPAVLLIIIFGLDKREDSIRQGIAAGNKLAASIAMEQYNLTGDAEQLLTVLAQLPEIRRHDVAATSTILANILKLSHQYANIVIADCNGAVWSSALPLLKTRSLKERRSFQNAVRTKQFSSGEYAVGVVSAKTIIGFGYPVLNAAGAVVDVILVSLNFSHLNQALLSVGLPQGASYSIIDHNGIIIDRNLEPDTTIGRKVHRDIALRLNNSPDEGDFISSADNGDQYINYYRKLRLSGEPTPYLSILTSIPLKATQEKAQQALIKNIAILTPFLLITVVLIVLVGNFCFVSRINRLREVAQRLSEGDLDSRATEHVRGGELGELGLAFDDMANKLAARERELVKSERELDDLYNQAPCGYHSLDPDGTIVRINDTELGWLGYARDEVVGKMNFMDIVTPEGGAAFRQSFPLLKVRGLLRDLEFALVRRDGTAFPVLLNASAIYGEDGSFLATRSTTYDITERTFATRRLNELNQNLANKVEEETGRRVQQERLLARHARLAALGEMLGAIAHQWRQPLATMGAIIQSIRMAAERNCLDSAFLQKAELDAQKQLYYMSDTIEDFRNFFRPDKVMERFDTADKVREAVLLISPQFTHSEVGLQIVNRSSGECLEVRGYLNEFKQALLNLISNSFDAIIEKQQQNVPPFEGLVVVSLTGAADSVTIEVQDNGSGIPPEYADKVFEPYFTSKPGGKGTGIGLYMSRLIIEESMAGSLTFTSGSGGTTFRIVLARTGATEGEPNV